MAKSRMSKLIDRYIVRDGKNFRLKDIDPGDTGGFKTDKDAAAGILKEGVERLCDLQEKLYAQDRWGCCSSSRPWTPPARTARSSTSCPASTRRAARCTPSRALAEELDHDFLWRTTRCLPERGRIGIFNRSYYEEVLVVRVHPELLPKQQMPRELVTKHIWKERYEDINALERYLGAKRHRHPQVLPARVQEGTAQALPEAARRARQAVEVLAGDLHERERWKDYRTPTRTPSVTRRHRTRRGSWSPRTRNGLLAGSLRRRSSMRSTN